MGDFRPADPCAPLPPNPGYATAARVKRVAIVFAWDISYEQFKRLPWAPPGRGKRGHLTPLDFDINFSHIITVAARVEI